jgi:putative DNA primase/helicase
MNAVSSLRLVEPPVADAKTDYIFLAYRQDDRNCLVGNGLDAIYVTDSMDQVNGRNVAVLAPESDGYAFEQAPGTAAHVLRNGAASVRIVSPNMKRMESLQGWLDEGRSVAELIALADATPPWLPSADATKTEVAALFDDLNGGFAGSAGSLPQEFPKFKGPPRPVVTALLPVPEFDPRLLPATIRTWIQDIAERGSFPIEYVAAAALNALGSVAGRKVVIKPKRHDSWYETATTWGMVVGPAGVTKSPAVAEARRPLDRLETEARERHEEAVKVHKEALLVAEVKRDAAKVELKKAAQKKQNDAHLANLAAVAMSSDDVPAPVQRRYQTNDATIEKMGELLAANPNGLLLFRDELPGFFRSMDRQGHEQDRAFYLEAWSGLGSFTFDRIGRGTTFVPNATVSIFGCIQPGPLASCLQGAASGIEADGLVQRFQLAVYPDVPEFVNVDRPPDADARARAYSVFKAIDDLDPVVKGVPYDDDRKLHYLPFDAEAQEFFDEWRSTLEHRLRDGEERPEFSSHQSKFKKTIPSLALLFHLIQYHDADVIGPIRLQTIQLAAAWGDLLEAHARRIYAMARDSAQDHAQNLADRIKQGRLPNPFTYREAAKKGWAGLDTSESVRRAVGILEGHDWVQVEEIPPSNQGGRPTEVVHINPAAVKGKVAAS